MRCINLKSCMMISTHVMAYMHMNYKFNYSCMKVLIGLVRAAI